MAHGVLVSVIINNYNYGRFLSEAVDSALGQTYRHVEVIAVDDGSTDDSLTVLRPYTDRVSIIAKENGGQATALNAGFQRSRGEIIVFLDSDDILLSNALEQAVARFDGHTAKVHWPLLNIDALGRRTGARTPKHDLPEGDLVQDYVQQGPEARAFPPTSGNAWSRQALEHVFPLPEQIGSSGSDKYLSMLVPFFGHVRRLSEPQSLYRLHGMNTHASLSFEDKLARQLWFYDYCCDALAAHCRTRSIPATPDRWKAASWIHRVLIVRQKIHETIGTPDRFILVDEGNLGLDVGRRGRVRSLIERDGLDWGAPEDDSAAITAVENHRHEGAAFFVLAWPAFWWFEHYLGFRDYVVDRFRCVVKSEHVVIFDLRTEQRRLS